MGNDRRVVTVDGGRDLEVLFSGAPDRGGRPPVLFHLGTPAGVAELPPALLPPDGTPVVLYSRPGYGRSTPHPGRTVADAARDTAAILDALDIDTFVTVGWSGGGPHALACAALLADRCTACAVIAGLAPYPAPVRDWTEGKAGVVLRGDDDGLQAACDADRDALSGLTGKDMAALFPAPADAGALTGAYADWLADVIRSAYLNGSSGPRDDWKAFVSDWGFELADARGVTLWQGDEDDIVPPAHAHWLKDHLPDSTLRLVSGEAHISIGLRLPEVIHDLTGRADPAA